MFVQGPPVYVRVTFTEEESTSVFVLNGEESVITGESIEVVEDGENDLPVMKEESLIEVAHSSVKRRLMYLETSFPRQVYRPLEFVLGDETVKGIIEKVDGETVLIETNNPEKEIVAIEMGKIEEILWRGDPFVEN